MRFFNKSNSDDDAKYHRTADSQLIYAHEHNENEEMCELTGGSRLTEIFDSSSNCVEASNQSTAENQLVNVINKTIALAVDAACTSGHHGRCRKQMRNNGRRVPVMNHHHHHHHRRRRHYYHRRRHHHHHHHHHHQHYHGHHRRHHHLSRSYHS